MDWNPAVPPTTENSQDDSALQTESYHGVYIKTFGCQMNEYDSERLETLAALSGFTPTDQEDDAQLVIVNTCSIREKAEHKLMGYLGRLNQRKQKNKHLKIVVSGCVAQQEGANLLKRAPYVDLVLGTDQIDYFDHYLTTLTPAMKKQDRVQTAFSPRKEAYRPNTMPSGRKSFVSIMKGCDKVCTYCIVPFTRGREKSRPMFEILHEVRYLVNKGHKEVTLIGQNVNSYGKDLGALQFTELLYKVSEIEGLETIRFTTSHPIDLPDALIQAFRDLPKLANHFHLPIQSGSDRVLQEMRSEYTVDYFMNRLNALREARPTMAISTDIIVGFPTESEDDFQQTMQLVEKARFDSAYSFTYSPRPHTRAAKMVDDIPQNVKRARLVTLQERLHEIGNEMNQKALGTVVRAYVEGESRHDSDKWTARTSENKLVHFDPNLCAVEPQLRTYIDLELVEAYASNFQGKPVQTIH